MTDAMGFVAAGGRSSRMGRDKAWLDLDGRSMIERVIDALVPVTSSVAIIANGPDYSRLGLPVFADEHSNIGPMEAIRTALENTMTPRVVLVACDLPFVTSDLFKLLLNIHDDCDAVIPVGPDEKPQPLCAIYWTQTLPTVRALIANGERKISTLFDRVPTRFVEFDELHHLARSELFFENVNTPEDYARALNAFRR
jgi:molybdenum cofactor guanylyltransferase